MQCDEPALSGNLGLRQPALGLLLAFFGAGTLVALMVVSPQTLGADDGARWKPWILGIGLLAVIGVGLGLQLRKIDASFGQFVSACLWLGPALELRLMTKF